jgi:ATP-dependent RNA helicase RhlE
VLTKEFLNDPISVEVASKSAAAQTVKQRAFRCDAKSKTKLAIKLISDGEWEQVLIFTRTRHGADRLTRNLRAEGIKSSAIHGDKSQNARVRALEEFKQRKIHVLVATDIAARGIDISQLPHVLNFEIPNVSEDYVHRIGRTGRAEHKGEAVSLVSNEERAFFKDIEKLIKQQIPLEELEGFSPEDWPNKVPSANEVQKARDERRKASFAARGSKQTSRGGNKANSNRRNSNPANARRPSTRRRSRGNKGA